MTEIFYDSKKALSGDDLFIIGDRVKRKDGRSFNYPRFR